MLDVKDATRRIFSVEEATSQYLISKVVARNCYDVKEVARQEIVSKKATRNMRIDKEAASLIKNFQESH